MTETRHSRQRDAVLQELCSRHDHPTAEELFVSLKKQFPSISLATVYRNLRVLTEQGKIITLKIDNSDHFDGNTKQHYHLYCTNCGRLYDLKMPMIPEISRAADSCSDCRIESYSLIFEGLCSSCLKNM